MEQMPLHIHLTSVDSTNNFLRTFRPEQESAITLVTADFQTAGRGQRGNSWESEAGKNIVYSLLIHPTTLKPSQMFAISEVAALSVCEALDPLRPSDIHFARRQKSSIMGRPLAEDSPSDECSQSLPLEGNALRSDKEGEFSIKWPNDIYYGNNKIAGILIETDIMGGRISNAIIGVGININQRAFVSDAPNPISLFQILGKETDRETLLHRIMQRFTELYSLLQQDQLPTLHTRYMQRLYRREGFHPYQDEAGTFLARIVDVEHSGHYILEDTEGHQRRYAFKEVSFCL